MFHDRVSTDFALRQKLPAPADMQDLAADSIRWLGENFEAPLVSTGGRNDAFSSYGDFLESDALQELLYNQPDLPASTDARTCAAFFIGRYAYFLAVPLAALHLRAGLTTDIGSKALSIGFEEIVLDHGDHSHELMVPHLLFSGAFSYCADIGELRLELERHLAPLIARLHAETRLSPGAQWRLAGDSLAFAFLGVGEKLGDVATARETVTALLKHPASPFTNPQLHFLSIDAPGLSEPRTCVARGGCCRYYKVEGGSLCSNCVLESDENQRTRMSAEIAAELAGHHD